MGWFFPNTEWELIWWLTESAARHSHACLAYGIVDGAFCVCWQQTEPTPKPWRKNISWFIICKLIQDYYYYIVFCICRPSYDALLPPQWNLINNFQSLHLNLLKWIATVGGKLAVRILFISFVSFYFIMSNIYYIFVAGLAGIHLVGGQYGMCWVARERARKCIAECRLIHGVQCEMGCNTETPIINFITDQINERVSPIRVRMPQRLISKL